MHFFSKKVAKKFASSKNVRNFAPQFQTGALVQLVRMPACHAGGRWFESCTHRSGERRRAKMFFGTIRSFFFCVFSRHLPLSALSGWKKCIYSSIVMPACVVASSIGRFSTWNANFACQYFPSTGSSSRRSQAASSSPLTRWINSCAAQCFATCLRWSPARPRVYY